MTHACPTRRSYDRRYGEQVGEEIRGLVQFGATIAESDYFNAQNLAQGLRSEADKFFSNCDLVLMPSSPGAAPEISAGTGDPAFNLFRSEEHTSELQSLIRISYAVF